MARDLDGVRAVGRDVTRRQESEPPSALSLSASAACARQAKGRRRRGGVRGPACAPERWLACLRGVGSVYEVRARHMGAEVVVIVTISSSSPEHAEAGMQYLVSRA